MILLYPSQTEYKIGSDFPFLTIPLDQANAQTESLEDFQWWAYSDDFQKWLKANPRQWVADSVDTSGYKSETELLESYLSLNQIPEEDKSGLKVKYTSFDDFVQAMNEISEPTSEQPAGAKQGGDKQNSADAAYGKEAVKFHFAYNKLLSDGKIKDGLKFSSVGAGNDIAVFIVVEDPQTGANVDETLKAFRMIPKESSGGSKIILVETNETLPGGALPENSDSESVFKNVVQDGFKVAAYSAAGITLFGVLKWVGGGLLARNGLKTIQKFSPKSLLKTSKPSVNILKPLAGGVKSLWGGIRSMATLKTTRDVLKTGSEFVKIGRMYKTGNAVKNFTMGAKFALKGSAKTGSKLIPFVGEVLMVIDAVGSIWNWYSNNQAPRYGELEDYSWIKAEFDPKSVAIGKPITICWSQPAGGTWGGITSFLFNNETRTTMELIKVAEEKGDSIFILTQVNSKDVQKQIAGHELTLVAFSNSDVVERGIIDNEDLEFKISYVDGISKIASQFNFQGYCGWDELLSEYQQSSDQLIISDPSAPGEYSFNFKDSEDNVINVVGEKVTDQQLEKYSDQDLINIFGVNPVKSELSPASSKNESEEFTQSGNVITFSDFHNLNMFEKGTSAVSKAVAKADAAGSDASSIADLSPEQKSTPAELAIYLVTNKEYANPQLRGKFGTGKFTNFIVDPEEYTAQEGTPITVEINSDELLPSTKAGIYTYQESAEVTEPRKKEEKEPKKEEPKKGEDEGDIVEEDPTKRKDYYVSTSPEDVVIKNKRHALIIRDRSDDSGINIFDKFLTDKDKEVLKIENWKSISSAKEVFDSRGDVTKVKLWNRYAPWGDRKRVYTVTDGESFELAKKFAEEVKDRIKYD
jgi:hypothetical protein